MQLLRTSVRPVVTFTIIAVLGAITHRLVERFADVDMAKTALVAMIATGSTIIGFWFGARKATETPGK